MGEKNGSRLLAVNRQRPSCPSCRSDGARRGRPNWCFCFCAARRSTQHRARSKCPRMSSRAGSASFLEQGTRGLRIRGEPEEREPTLARAKIGELMMRLELAEDLIEKRGFTDEWKRRAR